MLDHDIYNTIMVLVSAANTNINKICDCDKCRRMEQLVPTILTLAPPPSDTTLREANVDDLFSSLREGHLSLRTLIYAALRYASTKESGLDPRIASILHDLNTILTTYQRKP